MKKNDDKNLELYRKKIDILDKLIISNLMKRFDLVESIGIYKKKNSIKIEDKNREKDILDKIELKDIKKIYKLIFKLSKSKEF